MISFDQAIKIINQATSKPTIRTRDILECVGHICAKDIKARINVPSFNNSAMDGFGVKASWLEGATKQTPIKLCKNAIISAGDTKNIADDLTACHIMTGAPVPEWVEAVVPIEKTKADGDFIFFFDPVESGANIRNIGEDSKKDEVIVSNGTSITPEHIMILASQGISEIEIFERPKVKLISTGNELQAYNSGELERGKIYNSNAPYLIAKCKQLGIDAEFIGIFADDLNEFASFLDAQTDNSIIISTGAVSAGIWDFVPDALEMVGAKKHFHKVDIRPGKPILFATLKNGSLFFGLPGNPISSAIGFEFFVKKSLSNLNSIAPSKPIYAKAKNSFTKKFAGTQFLKAKASSVGSFLEVEILDGQESFKIAPLAIANSWVILSDGQQEVASETLVQIRFFNGEILHA